MPEISKFDIEEKPWEYIGYRGYVEFISTGNFCTFKRFAKLNVRLCLRLQGDNRDLE